MNKIKLHFNAFYLGCLTYENEQYVFELNKHSQQLLLKLDVVLVATKVEQNITVSKTLPLVFNNFLPKDDEKQQMLEQFGILKTDNDFEKLIKISKLSLDKTRFWIKAV